jgi:hypothetical protein
MKSMLHTLFASILIFSMAHSFEKDENADVNYETESLAKDFQRMKSESTVAPKVSSLRIGQTKDTAEISRIYDQLKAHLHAANTKAKAQLNNKVDNLINNLDATMAQIKNEVNKLK